MSTEGRSCMNHRDMTIRWGVLGFGALIFLFWSAALHAHSQMLHSPDLPGTPIKVQILDSLNSRQAKNGQMVHGVLAEKVELEGRSYDAGSPATVQVIAVAPAGMLESFGELSLQVQKVHDDNVLSTVELVTGEHGKKDLADSAPAVGTEAEIKPQTTLTFKVLPPNLAWTHDFSQNAGQEEASAGTK